MSEAGSRVCAQDHEQGAVRILDGEGAQRVGRVGHPAGVDLEATGLEALDVRHRRLDHGQAILGGADGALPHLLPRHVVHHQEHPVERQLVADVHRRDQVADVGRVEGAPEDAEALARHPSNLFAPNRLARAATLGPFRVTSVTPGPGISGSEAVVGRICPMAMVEIRFHREDARDDNR